MNKQDITIEFMYKKADYISPFTGIAVPIEIKQVFKSYTYKNKEYIYVISTKNVHYYSTELTNLHF